MDAALRRSTIRIVTWRLIPLLLLAYLAAYIDRINIGFAATALKSHPRWRRSGPRSKR